jgi:hypothetical protein
MKIESAITRTEINVTRKQIIQRLKNSIDQEIEQETQIKEEIEENGNQPKDDWIEVTEIEIERKKTE